MVKFLMVILLATSLSACSLIQPRKIPVQQGNIITQAQVDQLKPGMTSVEVKTIMGDPVLLNTFSDNRMDYVYTYESDKEHALKRISLTFDKGLLSGIEGNIYPDTRQAM